MNVVKPAYNITYTRKQPENNKCYITHIVGFTRSYKLLSNKITHSLISFLLHDRNDECTVTFMKSNHEPKFASFTGNFVDPYLIFAGNVRIRFVFVGGLMYVGSICAVSFDDIPVGRDAVTPVVSLLCLLLYPSLSIYLSRHLSNYTSIQAWLFQSASNIHRLTASQTSHRTCSPFAPSLSQLCIPMYSYWFHRTSVLGIPNCCCREQHSETRSFHLFLHSYLHNEPFVSHVSLLWKQFISVFLK